VKTVRKKEKYFVGRVEVLKELADDPEWDEKKKKAKNHAELVKVIRDFCKAKGYKVEM